MKPLALLTPLALLLLPFTAAGAEKVAAKGQVVAVAPGAILMTSDAGKQIQIKIPEGQSVVTVKGQLLPTQLQPGMLVRFTAAFEGTRATEPVSQMTVYSPADGFVPSVDGDPSSPVLVTAVFNKLEKNGTLTMTVNRKKITAEPAEGINIQLETGDYRLVKAGDHIVLDGRQADAKSPVVGRKVEITITNPELEAQAASGEGEKP